MFKLLAKTTDAYKSLPRDVTGFTVENIGSSWYIYAHFENKRKITVGRYKTQGEAMQALKTVEDITNSNNLKFY